MSAGEGRADELRARLEGVRRRVAGAAREAGRRDDEVHLIVVTKFFPASDVRLLHELGVRDVGENRHQEAAAKAAELADLDGLRWHFIGALQSNKASAVAAYADVVHSVDRAKLLRGLAAGAQERGAPLGVTVQVDLQDAGDDTGRAGAPVGEVAALADAVASTEALELRGVMAVAPLGVDPAPAFARLAEVAHRVRSDHPEATWVSAGMSGDLEQAVQAGATHVRVGSAVLGERPARR